MGVELATVRPGFHQMEDVSFSDSELVYHVRQALQSVPLGDTDSYDQLIGVLHHKERLAPDEVALLVTSLKALSGAVSCINMVHHKSLLSSVFGMSLWNYGPHVMDALVELILSLAASSGDYLDCCLDMLVSNFMPPYSFIDLLKQPRGLSRKDQVLSRVHSTLKDIADLVPLAPSRLVPIIIQRMPNVFTKEPLIKIYVENMLRLESGSLREFVGTTMLVALMDRLVDLDVEIAWEEILQDDCSKGIFEMEIEDMDEPIDDVENDGGELDGGSLSRKSLGGNLIAEKLDSLMVLTFEHLESCDVAGRLIEVFETLILSFQTTVLTAFKSKFAQFVMFYACALDPENCGVRFACMLADFFVCSSFPPLNRMSAVAYLASYLSRGKFLTTSFVANILERLAVWCLEYCKINDGDINPKAHQVFYSGCQAIMYVLCFRMRSMIIVPNLRSQLLLLPLEAILKHPLSPLKVCLPSIVEEFLRQSKAAQLFTTSETFIFSDLLESEFSWAFGGIDRLDMFFPFDPCLLKKCDRFIRPNFVYWSMVQTTYDDGEDSSGEEAAEGHEAIHPDCVGNDDEDDEAMARSYDSRGIDFDDFDHSMNKMSITPKNSLCYRLGDNLKVHMPSRIRPSTSPESL